ncbi:hypothetical protein FQZ97_768210 [compost metagenome]
MDDTGTGAQLDVVGEIDRRQALVERVTEADQFQRLAFRRGDHLALQAVALQAAFDQFLGQQQQLVANIDQGVIELRVDVERLVGGNGPGRGGPDHDARRLDQRAQAKSRGQPVVVLDREGHVDGIGFLVLVLDFRFSQGRAAVETPVDRLQALEHEPLLDHFGQGADLTGFVGEVHGLVWIVPITENAETDEIGLLPFDLLAGVGAATLAGLVGRLVLAEGGFHLVLDRQAVAVPTRHIRCVVAGQGLGTGDDVLEDLVDRMTDMNAAVGIGRTVVQDEFRPAFAQLPQLLIQTHVVPALQNLRLALRQAGLHRELGIRQVERSFVVGHLRLFI